MGIPYLRRQLPASLFGATASTLLAAACATSNAATIPVPARVPANTVILRPDWQAKVLLDREDSIVLTLPSGDHQLQRFTRHAVLSLTIDIAGKVTVRLDSLAVHSTQPNTLGGPATASWSGDLGDARLDALKVIGGGDGAAELTAMVRNLLPRIPSTGVRPESSWRDSAEGNVRVDIFNASEHRIGTWSVGSVTLQDGRKAIPVRVLESFEQLGEGNQGVMKITMTSQGKRSGIYYLSSEGRILGAQLSDSISMLISVPANRQVVPTTRFSRTTIKFLSAAVRASA